MPPARRRARGRVSRGPVAAEKNIETILRLLHGAARERFLRKWSNILSRAAMKAGVDIQQLYGIIDVTDLGEVERFLLENCHGLSEPECMKKVADIAGKAADRAEMEYEIASAEDYIRHVEEKFDIMAEALEKFNLPFEPAPAAAEELLKIYKDPSLDHEEVKRIVREQALYLGWPEEEAERIAEEAARVIEGLVAGRKKEAKPITTAHWLSILNYATRSARRRASMRRPSRDYLERIARELDKKILQVYGAGGPIILGLRELAERGMLRVEPARRTRTPEEAAELFRRHGFREARIVLAPPHPRRRPEEVVAFTYTDLPVLCYFERMKMPRPTGGVTPVRCTAPVIFVDYTRRAFFVPEVA